MEVGEGLNGAVGEAWLPLPTLPLHLDSSPSLNSTLFPRAVGVDASLAANFTAWGSILMKMSAVRPSKKVAK
jgi:hypothetical protein